MTNPLSNVSLKPVFAYFLTFSNASVISAGRIIYTFATLLTSASHFSHLQPRLIRKISFSTVMAPPTVKDELTKQLEYFRKEEKFLVDMINNVQRRMADLQSEETFLVLKTSKYTNRVYQ